MLRLATARDAQAIALLSRDEIERGLGWKYDPAAVARLIAEPGTCVVVCAQDLQLLGFAIMQFADDSAHLLLMAVQPAHRRAGIARRLLQWLLESARTAGVAQVNLELRAGNGAARALYARMGFVETGIVPGYYRQHEAALRMRLQWRSNTAAIPHWQAPTLHRR